jgi:nicotinate dehydrogenase subunit A
MATVALLAWNAQPSDADIRRALAGHLCRCGAHPRILRAVKRAAQEVAQ